MRFNKIDCEVFLLQRAGYGSTAAGTPGSIHCERVQHSARDISTFSQSSYRLSSRGYCSLSHHQAGKRIQDKGNELRYIPT